MNHKNTKVTILGPGAYGISLAYMFGTHATVTLWSNDKQEIETILKTRMNQKKLPGVKIKDDVLATDNLKDAVKDAKIIVISTPAFAIEDISKQLKPVVTKDQIICIASKGIQNDTGLFLSEVTRQYLENPIVVLAGPTFAIDLAKKSPAGLTIASEDEDALNLTEQLLRNDNLKLETSQDVIGVEFLRAIKNVIAIASGIVSGLGYPTTTNAFLITKTLQNFKEFLKEIGASEETILTYAGVGDMILTCTSKESRNYSFGEYIGNRKTQKEIQDYISHNTIEGLYTLDSIYHFIHTKDIPFPMIEILYQIIHKNQDPELLITHLIQSE